MTTHSAPGRDPGVSTAYAVSPDSGEHWTAEGAWRVADGIFRIPLPLPMDGLRAINVYVIETDDGLTLVDGGWAIPVARELLERCLKDVGYGFGDLRRFLVTHVHRDHFTMATVLGQELGIDVALGADEKPALDLLNNIEDLTRNPFVDVLVSAGAREVAEQWVRMDDHREPPDMSIWAYPGTWLEGDHEIPVGHRTLDAVHTPGHTPGHFVFADRAAGLLFAGDHVLPTITPSIGFTMPATEQPLGDFMASLTKVRGLPDLTILPAHGPVAPSSHARVDELLEHHERRLAESLALMGAATVTAHDVAQGLGWTRHETPFGELDVFSQGMAAMETKAHLELLVARGQAAREETPEGVLFRAQEA
ncbi:MBL fold metallo-hydrolase [Nocardioides sp. cx-169]|uniref:MBL fold metallo-hydrolase n=1 Tax=Nocardioides sp. cx-169 TaxID=2899080 RepID=UPI001E5EE83D|nr:MBL fold metallo-hydrolase [Nocardioides sp. cx-169]MCD4532663.1 MBL fold metallo-hydrolase [Nocardioides sp. cx-169]